MIKEQLKMVICAEGGVAREIECCFESVGFRSLGIAASASEAIELVDRLEPDLLVMEPYLAGMNCDELTAYLELEASPYLVKLVISERKQDLLAERFHSGGGDLFRLQPIDYSFTAKQIQRLRALRCRNFYDSKKDQPLPEAFYALLRQIGMPVSLKGFCYSGDAAAIGLEIPSVFRDFQRELYPVIAAKYQSTGYCVEHCIRTAVEATFKQGDPELIYRYFHPKAESGKVSNKEFIACLIELYKDQMQK